MEVAASLDPDRFDVTLLVQEREGRLVDSLPAGLSTRFIHQEPYRRGHLARSLVATIREALRHDVMIGANEGRASVCALMAAKLTGRRCIAWVHVGWGEFAKVVSWRQRAALRLYGRFDEIVAVSEGVAQDIRAILAGRPVPVSVIFNANRQEIGTAEIEPDHEALFDRPVVINAGRLDHQKNQAALIEAHAILLRRGLRHRLVILGEGVLHEELREQCRRLGVEDSVSMLGFVAQPQRYFRRSQVFALSSRFEGFSLVLSEAMSCGTPVVAFDCPHGPAEVLDGGRAGLLVPPGDVVALADAMELLLTDRFKADQLRQAGQERARMFEPAGILAQWEALLARHGASVQPAKAFGLRRRDMGRKGGPTG